MSDPRLGLEDLAAELARRAEAERAAEHKAREDTLAEKIRTQLPGAEVRLLERANDVSIVVRWQGRRYITAARTIDTACRRVLLSARPRLRGLV